MELNTLKQKSIEAFSKLPDYNFKYGLNITLNPPKLNLNEIKNSLDSTSYIHCPLNIILKSKKDKDSLDYLNSVIPFNTNKFTSLHYSELNDFMFITIPKGSQNKEPIVLNNDTSKNTFSHVIVLAEENSKITIIDKDFSEKESDYYSKCVELILKDNAKINYIHFNSRGYLFFNFDGYKAAYSSGNN